MANKYIESESDYRLNLDFEDEYEDCYRVAYNRAQQPDQPLPVLQAVAFWLIVILFSAAITALMLAIASVGTP